MKSKLEKGHLSVRWRRFLAGSLKKSVVCGNHSDVPAAQNKLTARAGLSVVCLH